jgi:hypothetical protein
MPLDQIKDKAAQIARDTHWTYSDTYAFTKQLKKVPFVAPFISFTSEVIRTSINLVKLARSEIREGKATGNRELEKIGWGRARGMATAATLPAIIGTGSAAMFGISGDDEEDLRKFLPDWQKNNQLLMLGREGGKIKFVDISFTDPYGYLKNIFTAAYWGFFTNDDVDFGNRLKDGTVAALGELTQPWISEQLFTGSIMDIARNKDASGREIVNWQDSGANIAQGIIGHLTKPFLPGTYDSLERVFKAAGKEVSETGRSYDFGNEVMGFLGTRVRDVDIRQALGFKASKFMSDYRDASSVFTSNLLSRGTRNLDEITSSYDVANSSAIRLVEDLKNTISAAKNLGGLADSEIYSILKASGVSNEMIKAIKTGKFQYVPSKQAITRARQAGNLGRVRAAERAINQAAR